MIAGAKPIARYWLLGLVGFVPFGACPNARAEGPTTQTITVEAPFQMPGILTPDFSDCQRFSIVDFGAQQGDQALTTIAITNAITAANQAGGGCVIVPRGDWKTGRIHLKSRVNLHLQEGAVLIFSGNPADYLPPVKTTWEGMECLNYSPLVYAYDCDQVAVTGQGTLRAELEVFKTWYGRPKPHMEALKRLYHLAAKGIPVENRDMVGAEAHLRPHFVQFNRCRQVLVEGVRIANSPFWVVHPFLCRDVVIRGINVYAHGHNNDGVDLEMSQSVLVENCDFDQGDDAIAIKSGRNQDAWRLNTPTKNVVVRNCKVRHGHQMVAIGSELSGGIENILIENCQVDNNVTSVGHLLYIKTNSRRGGFVRNVFLQKVSAGDLKAGVLGIETDVLYQWRNLVPTYEEKLTPIKDIFVEDVVAKSVKYITKIQGQSAVPVKHVLLRRVTVADCRSSAIQNQNTEEFWIQPLNAESSEPQRQCQQSLNSKAATK